MSFSMWPNTSVFLDDTERTLFIYLLFVPHIISVHVYAVIISKYATKIVGNQNRQVACLHGTQYQMQWTINKFKPGQ